MSDTQTITFQDNNLFEALLKHFGEKVISHKDLSLELKTETINQTEELTLNNLWIENISGIEKFTKLIKLNLSNNAFSDISSLKDLTSLKRLEIFGNTIKDISPLMGLINLEYLDISRNQINDEGSSEWSNALMYLQNLTKLKELNVSHCFIRYINGVHTLTQLTTLDLYDNAIHDINYLYPLTNLVTLKLGMNNEKDGASPLTGLDSLKSLTNLKELDLSYNNTPNICSSISTLTSLEDLRLESNFISDISGLSKLTNLKRLILYYNKLENLSPIGSLINLEELNLSRNGLYYANDLYDDNTSSLKLTKLKKFSLANTVVYMYEGNKKLLDLLGKMAREKQIEFDYQYDIFDTSNLPHVDSNGIKYVTYEDFGAFKTEGKDDFVAMKYTHTFANEKGCEVRGTQGSTYHIYKYYDEPFTIKTNVDWNGATFVIHDEGIEDYYGRTRPLLEFNYYEPKDVVNITDLSFTIGKSTKKISEIKNELDKLKEKGYKKFYCKAVNSNVKMYIRYGMNENDGFDMQDYFIIDTEGNVLNDIQWDFKVLTSFTLYPIPEKENYFRNGNIFHKIIPRECEVPYDLPGKSIYYYRNLNFNHAFNFSVSNIKHYPEKDTTSGSYIAFFTFQNSAFVEFKDSTLFAKYYSGVGRSTYDLGLTAVVNFSGKNLQSEDLFNPHKWGIMESSFSKDVSFDNVKLNRIDAHEGIYNLNVTNSVVGYHGISVIGQNQLNVYNSSIYATDGLISLRGDYGSVWDGQINIINSTLYPLTFSKICGYSFSFDSDGKWHNFGYDLKYPKFYISNLVVDYNLCQYPGYPYLLFNDKAREYARITDITRPYLSKAEMIIDNILFKNVSLSPKNSFISYDLIENFTNNVFISNLNFKGDGYDVTNNLYFNKKGGIIFEKNLNFKIWKNDFSNNTVKIYKDDSLIEEFLVENETEHILNETGDYKIKIDSVELPFGYKGNVDYLFSIGKNTPPVPPKKDEGGKGSSTGVIVVVILVVLAVIGAGVGFLFYRKKKKENVESLV